VVLASGRPTPAMLSYAKELGLHQNNSYILAYNGAVILDMTTKEVLFEQSISKEDIHALYDFSQENGVHIITYLDGNIIALQNRHISILKLILQECHCSKWMTLKSGRP
jgi:hydroxymethylpyrimidine pyrophosphatase-like HAD family hydrolase